MMARSKPTVEALLKTYRDAAERTNDPNPKIANRWVDKMHKAYKQLRESEQGREAITTLLSDPNVDVRAWAASHVLRWAPQTARPVLEQIRDAKGRCSFDAEMVLREFDKGTLSRD